jgi:serine/threonine protein kinase
MEVTFTNSSAPGSPTQTRHFLFVKNIFRCEESSSRVDLLKDLSTHSLLVQKEYTIKQYEEKYKRGVSHLFTKKCEDEIRLVFDQLGSHPHICEAIGWFRGGFPEGIRDPDSYQNFTLLYRYYSHSPPEISLPTLRTWLQGVLSGLAHIHSKNLIFTNFKIDNVLYDKSLHKVVLIDFGDLTLHNKAYPYAAEGSGIYKAPEQLSGIFDYRADLFSVGMALVQLSFGNESIGGIGGERRRTWWEKLKLRTTDDFQFWDESFGLGAPLVTSPPLRDVIFHLTHYDPSQRLTTHEALQHPFLLEIKM